MITIYVLLICCLVSITACTWLQIHFSWTQIAQLWSSLEVDGVEAERKVAVSIWHWIGYKYFYMQPNQISVTKKQAKLWQ